MDRLKQGWYWARHRFWDATKGQWLLIFVEGKTGWRSQNCHLHSEKNACLYRVDEFEDFRPILQPDSEEKPVVVWIQPPGQPAVPGKGPDL